MAVKIQFRNERNRDYEKKSELFSYTQEKYCS